MPEPTRKRELGRGERVLPGVWRLRLPLPWPGVPHCNAWAVAAGDGIVLFDTGMHEPGSIAHLERALGAGATCASTTSGCSSARTPTPTTTGRRRRSSSAPGCELWMHPNHEHMTQRRAGPRRGARAPHRGRAPERRARRSRCAPTPEAAQGPGLRHRRRSSSPTATCSPGVEVADRPRRLAGRRDARATRRRTSACTSPSAACSSPATTCSGASRSTTTTATRPTRSASSWTRSSKVEDLDARLCLAGHARPFTDVQAHIDANRALVAERLEGCLRVLREHGPITAFEVVPLVYGEAITPANANWWLSETLCYLHAPRGDGPRRAHPRRARTAIPSAGRSRPNLSRCAHRRDPDGQRGAGLLVRVLPAQDRRTARRTSTTALAELQPLEPAYVSVTYGAGGSTRDKTIEIVSRIRDEFGLEAMAHFTCVGATDRRAARDARPDGRAGHRQRPRAARRPAGGPGGVDEDRGRARVLARARRADPRRLRLLGRRGVLPRDAHPRDEPRGRPAHLKDKVDAGVDFLDHPALLRQRGLLRLRRARARDRHRRADHPGHHADHEHRAARADHRRSAAPSSPTRCAASSTRARTSRTRSRTSASPTRRCSARSCSPAAPRGSTSTR